MKRVIVIATVILFSSCNQSKIDDLTSKVATLKRDSADLTSLTQMQKIKIDSLTKKVMHLDSLLAKVKKGNGAKSSGYTCTYCGIHFSSMWDRCAQNTRGAYHVPVGGYGKFTDQDIKNAMQGK